MGVQKIRAGGGAHHVRTGRQRLGQVLRGNHLRAGQGDGAAEIGPLGQRPGEAGLQPRLQEGAQFFHKGPGQQLRVGHHQGAEGLRAGVEQAVFHIGFRGKQGIDAHHVAVDLMLSQRLHGLFEGLAFAAPFRFRMVNHRHGGHMSRFGQGLQQPVGVIGPDVEQPELGVFAPGVEMGRAVGIREGGGGEGVGGDDINPLHRQMVGDPLHQPQTLEPTVCAEGLAQHPAVLLGVGVGGGGGHFGQAPVGEIAIEFVEGGGVAAAGLFWHQVIHHVDAAGVQALHGPEEVARAVAQAAVGAVFFHQMAHQQHVMPTAPVAQLAGEVLGKQTGNHVHIGVAHVAAFALGIVVPQKGNQPVKIPQGRVVQKGGYFLGPGQGHAAFADDPVVAGDVAKAGLVGEEARDAITEQGRIVGVMPLMHQFDIFAYAFPAQGVDVILGVGLLSAGRNFNDEDAPFPLRHGPVQPATGNQMRQVHQRIAVQGFLPIRAPGGHDPIEAFPFPEPVVNEKMGMGQGAGSVHVVFQPVTLGVLGIFFRQFAVGHAAGIIAVVKQPHDHVQFFRLLQNEIQILPPAGAQIIRMGTGLHHKIVDAHFLHAAHFFFDGRMAVSPMPEKGIEHMDIFRIGLKKHENSSSSKDILRGIIKRPTAGNKGGLCYIIVRNCTSKTRPASQRKQSAENQDLRTLTRTSG